MVLGFIHHHRYHTAESGGNGGATSAPIQTGGGPGEQTQIDATGQVPAPVSGATPPTMQPPTPSGGDKTFTQADIDRIVSDRLAEEKRRSDQRAADAAKKTKEEALRQAGEWQALAESRGTEIAALQGASERAETLSKALNDIIREQIADWPDEVKALDPGKDNVEARIAWVKSAKPLAERLRTAPKAPTTEAGAGNRPPSTPTNGNTQDGKRYRFQNPNDVKW